MLLCDDRTRCCAVYFEPKEQCVLHIPDDRLIVIINGESGDPVYDRRVSVLRDMVDAYNETCGHIKTVSLLPSGEQLICFDVTLTIYSSNVETLPEVWASQMEEDFYVENVDGNKLGLAGDYLVRDNDGVLSVIRQGTFESVYKRE